MERVALLGGSFDPVHNGHIFMAEKVLAAGIADRVEFVPLRLPPHKTLSSDTKDRLHMLYIALNGKERMSVNEIELYRAGNTYTYDTVRILHRINPEIEYYYVIGDDSMAYLEKWYEAEKLFKLITFVVICRAGFENERERIKERLVRDFGASIILLDSQRYDVSSTEIRTAANAGNDFEADVPSTVAAYIREKGLYEQKKNA